MNSLDQIVALLVKVAVVALLIWLIVFIVRAVAS